MRALLLSSVIVTLSAWASGHGQLVTSNYKLEVNGPSPSLHEILSIKNGDTWIPALTASGPVRIVTANAEITCAIQKSLDDNGTLVVSGPCGDFGTFEQRFSPSFEADVLEVSTRVNAKSDAAVRSVEDRFSFEPTKHANVTESQGLLDFVWSQNIKREKNDLIPFHAFKSPAVMMQQGPVFAAVLAEPDARHIEPLALDLDVTSEAKPWMSYGLIPSTPHDHSYFRRAAQPTLHPIANTFVYRYALVLSAAPEKLGYRRVTRLLWQRLGQPAFRGTPTAQQNVLHSELDTFASWRNDAWHTYADRVYREFPCGPRTCATLVSDRNCKGEFQHPEPDAWFNAWFQTLRTAYGWYAYGRAHGDKEIMRKSEQILNLALSSPQKEGAFSTIYLLNGSKWIPSDGWAGFSDSYHAFSMSWTAYWMLRWAEDLTPQRKDEVLAFVKPYGEFLLHHQEPSGVIPSWYFADTLQPRKEFRDFNAETAPSALLLAELGNASGEVRFTQAAERAMTFVQAQVLPRQRWFDFETYFSCARKPLDFFDPWTAQYPQNNLAEIQAPQAMLSLYKATHDEKYLTAGANMLDYLLLTQQVWSNPEFSPALIGGFTTQNTDAEWSDARQSYAATLLLDYYDATGKQEYLDRAVAAARSTFAVAPWENWAHTGFINEPGALTGFHWGTGSAMTSVEMMSPELGDGLIDLARGTAVGFDESSITNLVQDKDRVSFTLISDDKRRAFHLKVRGADAAHTYSIRCNNQAEQRISGKQLLVNGLTVTAAN